MPLTDAQQKFLNDYIREHRFSGSKKKQAEKYARRRDKVSAALDKLPKESPDYSALKKRLDEVDKTAERGEFKAAYKQLDQIKTDARSKAGSFDPTSLIKGVSNAVDNFASKASALLPKKTTLDAWLTTTAPPRLAQLALIPGDQIPKRDDYDSIEDWSDARKRMTDQKTEAVKQIVGGLFDGYPEAEASDLDKFYSTANDEVGKLKQQIKDVARGCADRGSQLKLNDVAQTLTRKVLLNPALGPLRVTPDGEEFRPARHSATLKADVTQQMKTRVEAIKQQLHQLRTEVTEAATHGQKGRDAPAKTKAAPISWAKEDLTKEESADTTTLAEKKEKPRKAAAAPPLPIKDFANFLASADPTQLPTDDDVRTTPDAAKDLFKRQIQANNANGDAVFELQLKAPADLKKELRADLINARKWNPDALTAEQTQWLDAMTDGAVRAVDELAPAKFDSSTGRLTMGTETYGNPVHLGTGGMGTVSRYESLTTPNKYVAVKTLKIEDFDELTEDDKESIMDDMINELRSHRELMKGPKGKGRDLILEFKEVARNADGSLSVVMEALDGGDLEENRLGGVIAAETGALPEEARALLNQYQMKQALEGMVYMRDQNMTHFDLKPENIFMTSEGKLKIADFGTSEISKNAEGASRA